MRKNKNKEYNDFNISLYLIKKDLKKYEGFIRFDKHKNPEVKFHFQYKVLIHGDIINGTLVFDDDANPNTNNKENTLIKTLEDAYCYINKVDLINLYGMASKPYFKLDYKGAIDFFDDRDEDKRNFKRYPKLDNKSKPAFMAYIWNRLENNKNILDDDIKKIIFSEEFETKRTNIPIKKIKNLFQEHYNRISELIGNYNYPSAPLLSIKKEVDKTLDWHLEQSVDMIKKYSSQISNIYPIKTLDMKGKIYLKKQLKLTPIDIKESIDGNLYFGNKRKSVKIKES